MIPVQRFRQYPERNLELAVFILETAPSASSSIADLGIRVEKGQLRSSEEKHSWENVPTSDKGAGKFYPKAQPGGWKDDLLPGQVRIIEEVAGPVVSDLY